MTIEEQYQAYLLLVGLNEATMHPVQKLETKRAFFASAGQLLLYFRDTIGAMEENAAIKEMDSIKNEIARFWDKQNNRVN